MHNVFLGSELVDMPTFHRNNGPLHTSYQSVIDYMFVSGDIVGSSHSGKSLYVNNDWSDHHLLSFSFAVGSSICGKGNWRANPLHALSDRYTSSLGNHLAQFVSHTNNGSSPQEHWDALKHSIQQFTRQFGRDKKKHIASLHKRLQRQRNKYLRALKLAPQDNSIQAGLHTTESQLDSIQDDIVYVSRLKSGVRWLENGEKSAGYLKRTATARTAQTRIHALQHPVTRASCTTSESMKDAARCFYERLYSTEDVDTSSMNELLSYVSTSTRLTATDVEALTMPFTLEEIQLACYSPPKQSSPGMDGLPYDILRLILTDPNASALITTIYNQALDNVFPSSWQETCVTLLPKKGDLSLLSNWRPISLINTDAKVFTRLLTQRIQPICQRIVNPFQTGFVKGRFIGDNGALIKCILDDAKLVQSSAFGLMLDQEKAYDRVHPLYLRATLLRFGFPIATVDCIVGLFFNTHISFNINGFISQPIHQHRGLRQGDPLSPLLFNLAFEPLLLGINHTITGYQMLPRPPAGLAPVPSVKFTAYADDILVLCDSPGDSDAFLNLYQLYARASNAKLNPGKSIAFMLTGKQPPLTIKRHLGRCRINKWYSEADPLPLSYLGYPLLYSRNQGHSLLSNLVVSLSRSIHLHSQRQLSILGRATVMNTLILSKLWHILRLFPIPLRFMTQIRSIVIRFTSRHTFPAIGYAKLLKPKHEGGLGLLDPSLQQRALQLRFLRHLLQPPSSMSPLMQPVVAFLVKHTQQRSHVVPLFFPATRRSLGKIGSLCHLLFHSLDSLPQSDAPIIDLPPVDWLPLPLGPFLLYDDSQGHLVAGSSFHRSSVYHVLQLGSTGQWLQWRSPQSVAPHYRSLMDSLQSGTIRFSPPLASRILDVYGRPPLTVTAPPRSTIYSLGDCFLQLPIAFHELPTKLYRSLLPLPHGVRLGSTVSLPVSALTWKMFWRLTMPHRCRTFWFRFLHDCLPTRVNLHHRIPNLFPSPMCHVCSIAAENSTHMLFSCPTKLPFWKSFFHEFFICPSDTPSLQTLFLSALSQLSFPPVRHPQDIPLRPHQIFSAALTTIWQAHWRFVFDDQPILSDSIRTSTYAQINTLLHHKNIPFLNLHLASL
jgi:hypothetical protein